MIHVAIYNYIVEIGQVLCVGGKRGRDKRNISQSSLGFRPIPGVSKQQPCKVCNVGWDVTSQVCGSPGGETQCFCEGWPEFIDIVCMVSVNARPFVGSGDLPLQVASTMIASVA